MVRSYLKRWTPVVSLIVRHTSFPFCGSLKLDYELFKYFIFGVSEQGIELTGEAGFWQHTLLKHYDVVNLHVAFKVGERFCSQAVVDDIECNTEKKQTIYKLSFLEQAIFKYPTYAYFENGTQLKLDHEGSLRELLIESVRECTFLKKGVRVYIKHLIAYFSRTVGYSRENYPLFSRFFFDDILMRLQEKIEKLQMLEKQLIANQQTGLSEFALDFGKLYDWIDSEVNLDLLNLAFQKGDHIAYVIAIKELEERLSWHYNTMLLVYEALLSEQSSHIRQYLDRKTGAGKETI